MSHEMVHLSRSSLPSPNNSSLSRGIASAYGGLPQSELSPLFQAVIEATEEEIYNSLLRATTVTGNEHTVEALPIEKVKEILRKYGRIQ